MPTWVPTVLIPIAILLGNIVLQFYFKWVPDVEKQKRHVQWVANWAIDIATLAGFSWLMYRIAQRTGTVTPSFVVQVALASGCFAFCAALILVRRTFGSLFGSQLGSFKLHVNQSGRHLDSFERHVDQYGRHLDNFTEVLRVVKKLTEVHAECKEAIQLLAQDANLSPEDLQRLKALVGDKEGQQDGARASRLLPK